MDKIVEIKNLRVTLGKNILVLDDINLDLESGKITGLIGPSGAGKTTLLRAIVGRVLPVSGDILVFGQTPGSVKLRSEVAYMTQDTSVYKDLTVEQNLIYFAKLYGDSGPNEKINNVLDELELTDKRNSLVKDLSGGQKQRVSLAVALVGSHKLIILDEPTTGLDPVLRMKLWKIFKKLRDSGVSIIISSHAMDEAQRCDNIVLIRQGKVIAHDSPANVMKNTKTKSIENAFLKLVGASK